MKGIIKEVKVLRKEVSETHITLTCETSWLFGWRKIEKSYIAKRLSKSAFHTYHDWLELPDYRIIDCGLGFQLDAWCINFPEDKTVYI
jgi:hypothetical protein